jgi:pyruvate dehydrogenase E2 component (dihydrolipoamide acetyltransferase)
MEIPAPKAGIVKSLKVKLGDRLKEGDELLELEAEGAAAAPEAAACGRCCTGTSRRKTCCCRGASCPGRSCRPLPLSRTFTSRTSARRAKPKSSRCWSRLGDTVEADQSLITLESDKASMEIPSPAAGVVESISVKLEDEVGTGDFILKLKVQGAAPAAAPAPAAAAPAAKTEAAPAAAAPRQPPKPRHPPRPPRLRQGCQGSRRPCRASTGPRVRRRAERCEPERPARSRAQGRRAGATSKP